MKLRSRWLGLFGRADVDWDAVYTEELPRVYNFLRYRVGDDALAQDLTSATFERAWRARAQYQTDRAAFSTWLFTVARNAAADHFRRDKRAAEHEQPLDDESVFVSPEPQPDRLIEAKDEARRLHRCLATLKPAEREVLALKHGASMNNRQIAAVLGLSESNVGTLAMRGLARLRTLWQTAV
jgi:RNA polymerase sigma-70 factor, ECF subfamily